MKVTQIFGLVLLFHLVAISLILLQPGCQTQPPPPPPESDRQTGLSSGRDYGSESARADYVPPVDRREPSRPAGSSSTAGTSTDQSAASGDLDPAFNAGLTGDSSSGVLQPMLEPSVDLGSSAKEGASASSWGETETYTVTRGDNLSRIAREFGVSVAAIKSANGLNSSVIRVGQELEIPSPSAPTQTTSVDAAGSETYTVRSGDTLSGIANRHGVTVSALKSANGLSSDRIVVGQDLYLPASSRRVETSSSSRSQPVGDSANTYTVQAGDTPSGIASRFGINYRELMEANNIASASRMQVGQRLIIPGGGRDTASASTSSSRQTTSSASTSATRSSLDPQTSQPARIGEEDSEPEPDEPADEMDLLENGDLPLMDVEVVDEE